MASILAVQRRISLRQSFSSRLARFVASASTPSSETPSLPPDELPKHTHFKITLRRSAISLPKNIKGTLVSLGIHRRMQTVYHLHSPEVAGKILKVKELVEVENVPQEAVRTKLEQKRERKPTRGYQVVGSRMKGIFSSA